MQSPVTPASVRGWFELVAIIAGTVGTMLTVLWWALRPNLEEFVVMVHRKRAPDIKRIEAESWAPEIARQEANYHLAQQTAAALTAHTQSFEHHATEMRRFLPVLTTLPNVLMSLEHTISTIDGTMRDLQRDLSRTHTAVEVHTSELVNVNRRIDFLTPSGPHSKHP